MACYHPLAAFQCTDGSIVFSETKGDVLRSLTLPCGQCIGCRLERSRQWAIRCMHEASLYPRNCFITLTYNDEHLPPDGCLHYDDFQRFMKRLRKRFCSSKVRFYMCGEYGENFGRPHFHACLFNVHFDDCKPWRRSGAGSVVYRSETLEQLWPFGFSSVGEVTFESAAYVARYVMKKVTGRAADSHYEVIDQDSGEITPRVPEFNHMSLKPGIGADWLKKYRTDVYPHDRVIVNGKEVKPPKYYDKKFAEEFPDDFEALQFERYSDALTRLADNTPDRLAAKAIVTRARLSQLQRNSI